MVSSGIPGGQTRRNASSAFKPPWDKHPNPPLKIRVPFSENAEKSGERLTDTDRQTPNRQIRQTLKGNFV